MIEHPGIITEEVRVEARWPRESCAECELVIYLAGWLEYLPLERFPTSLCRFGCGLLSRQALKTPYPNSFGEL